MASAVGAGASVGVVNLVQHGGGVARSIRNVSQPTKIACFPGTKIISSSSSSTVRRRCLSSVGSRAPAPAAVVPVRAVAMQDSLTDEDSEGIGEMGLRQRELKDYPPGLQRYETMAVLRPDISEEQRLALTQRYEEAIIAGGGLDVEMFNRGMQPLAYGIGTKNMSGVSSRYLDGIYLLFTYVTKPDSQLSLQKRLNADDDIIRSTTFRLKV
ncbi:unnamed protein product [Calypogeia fissa]